MPTIFSKRVSSAPGWHIKSKSKVHDAVIILDKVNTAPTTSGTVYAALYQDTSNRLVYSVDGVDTIIGAAGAAATTWEALYANDATMALTSAVFTISQSAAAGILSLNKTNVGAGAVLTIANSGSGNDITGPAWSIISTGSVGILELTSGGTINAAGGALTIGLAGTATTLAGSLTVDETATITGAVTATASVTITGADGSNVLVVTAGDGVFSNGSVSIVDTDNAASLSVTNNTATTIGAAAASGVVEFASTSVTTGTLLHLELTEGTLAGGYYMRCWDVTAGAAVFSIGENGAAVIAGAATGTDALTLTLGDLSLGSGALTVVDAADAASLSVTNDTATTASVFVFAGSGAFTGSTTTSFFTITPSGLTSGTAVYLPVVAMTEGKAFQISAAGATQTTGTLLYLDTDGVLTGAGSVITIVADAATTATAIVNVSADALTTGKAMLIASTSAANTSAELLSLNHTISGATVANKSGNVASVVSSRTYTKTSGTVADDYDALSLIRTSVTTGAGGTLTSAGSVLYIQNVVTQTAGTLTDTTKGIEIVMDADGTGNGISITHSNAGAAKSLNITSSGTTSAGAVLLTANAITTGQGMLVNVNGITEGQGLSLAHTTSVITTGSVFKVSSTGVDTGTGQGTLAEFISSGATAAVIVRIAATAITNGIGLQVLSNTLTTGKLVSLAHTTGVIANGGTMLSIASTSIDTATTSGCLVNLSSTASVAGTQVLLTSSGTTTGIGASLVLAALTEGVVLNLSAASITTGYYIKALGAAGATMFTVGLNGAVTIAGSAAETDAVTITAGDITLTAGLLNLESGTATAVGNAATLNKATGEIQSSTADLASLATETLTITNSRVSATSKVYAWVSVKGTGGQVQVVNTVVGAGSFTVDVKNIHATTAMSSVYKISYCVIGK